MTKLQIGPALQLATIELARLRKEKTAAREAELAAIAGYASGDKPESAITTATERLRNIEAKYVEACVARDLLAVDAAGKFVEQLEPVASELAERLGEIATRLDEATRAARAAFATAVANQLPAPRLVAQVGRLAGIAAELRKLSNPAGAI